MLALADIEKLDEKEIKEHLITSWKATEDILKPLKIIIAYESVGDWGCDSSGFYLFKDKKANKYYEVHGSHCSCYGFEDQFELEEATLEYLKSDKFNIYAGGHENSIKEYIQKLK